MFNLDGMSRTGGMISGALWIYTTDDTIETVLTDGYFNDFNKTLKVGDIIECNTAFTVFPLIIETIVNDVVTTGPAVQDQLINRKRVRRIKDIQAIDPDKEYFIDGELDLAGLSIEVPAEGLLIRGYGFEKSRLVCSEDNYEMFTSPVGGSGDIIIHNLALEVTGANSKVFALTDSDGTHACECERVNFDNCVDLGYIDGYRQGLESDTGRFGGTPSLEFRGAWGGGYKISTSIARGLGSGTTLFKGATGMTFQSRFETNINADIPAGAVGYDFAEANFTTDAGFRISGAFFTGAGTYLQGLSETSRKARISDSFGIRNTYVGAYWKITSAAGTSASSTPAKLAGTTAFTGSWFSQSANNAATVATSQPLAVSATFQGSFSGTASRQYSVLIRQWDDSASMYIDHPATQFTCNAAGNAENVILISPIIEAGENDRFEVWCTDDIGSSTLTALVDGQFKVSEVRS